MSLSKTLETSLMTNRSEEGHSWFDFARLLRQILAPADVQINGDRPWDIQVNNDGFYKRALTQTSMGFGESYMEGWWDCEALDQLFAKLSQAYMQGKIHVPLYLIIPSISFSLIKGLVINVQDKTGAKNNVHHHYDLGNDFYQAMLDKHMLYSCAHWKNATNIDEAQEDKLELICQKLRLKPGMRLLDIGCGWGSLAKYAAEHFGVSVVGITVSQEQCQLAREACNGLAVEIRLQDYRDLHEEFDRIVSVGMFEHVGKKNYRSYMEKVHSCLKEHGSFLLQTIASNQSTAFFDPWMNKYIFPGASIPSIKQVGKAMEGLFIMEDWNNAGPDYDKTLMSWFYNFDKNWPCFSQRYGHTFYRMWKYYLLSCAGVFRGRKQQLWRILLSKNGQIS